MISGLFLATALSMQPAQLAINVTIYKVNPDLSVASEDTGALVSADYVAGDLIVAYIPDTIFRNGFD